MSEVLQIPPTDLRRIDVRIKGVTPLLCSNGAQAIEKLEESQKGPERARGPKQARDPQADFKSSLYEISDGRYGFPGTGVARAIRDAATRLGKRQGTQVTATVRVTAEYLQIEGDGPTMHTAFVRHGGKVADLAYRGMFDPWQMTVPLLFNASVVSESSVVELVKLAGFAVGIGAWRPERNGTFGQFEIADIVRYEAGS